MIEINIFIELGGIFEESMYIRLEEEKHAQWNQPRTETESTCNSKSGIPIPCLRSASSKRRYNV